MTVSMPLKEPAKTMRPGDSAKPGAFVSQRKSGFAIFAEVWEARGLVAQFVLRDLTIRYTQAIMGFAWALLMPILIVGAGVMLRVVMSTVANTPIEGISIGSLAAKALPWAFFSGSLTSATQSIVANSNLIGKVYFPRESIPLATVIAQSPDLLVGLIVVAVILPFIGVSFSFASLWVVVALLLLIVFTVGCALLLSCANLFYRDVKYIMQVMLNFGVFATPVFFEPQMLGPKGAPIMMALPLSPLIQAMDIALIQGHSLLDTVSVATKRGVVVVWSPWMLLYAVASSLVLLTIGMVVFRRASTRFAEMA
jgi:lipopolysaccharide transport system permease protein